MARPYAVGLLIPKERCKCCQKTYEFTTENFRWCISCSTYYCKYCVPFCQGCITRDVCLLCAEKHRDEYKLPLGIHRCHQCARIYAKAWAKNP